MLCPSFAVPMYTFGGASRQCSEIHRPEHYYECAYAMEQLIRLGTHARNLHNAHHGGFARTAGAR